MAAACVISSSSSRSVSLSEKFPPGTRGRLTPATHAALHDTAELLRDLGHEVEPKDPDFRAQDVPVLVALMFRGMRDIVGEIERRQRLERRTRAIARPGAPRVGHRRHVVDNVAERGGLDKEDIGHEAPFPPGYTRR